MSPGKFCSQAGHAYLGAYCQAVKLAPTLAAEYVADPASPGTKVCLQADIAGISRAQYEAERLGLPHFLVVDSGCENFFDGKPVITALGFGPAKRDYVKSITRRFKLL